MSKKVQSLLNRLYGKSGKPSRVAMGNLADFFQIALAPIAAGNITGTTGAATMIRGIVVPARSGAGVYTLTLTAGSSGINANSCQVLAWLTNNSGIVQTANTSDTVKTVSTFAVDGTTATDKNFSFIIWGIETGIA